MRLPWPLAVALVLAGCIAPGPAPASPVTLPGPILAFQPPVRLTTQGPGFEPSLDVGPDGVLYAAAAKSHRPNDDDYLGSWLWYSTDRGATWKSLPSPLGLHRLQPGLEGDTAVDGRGRLYFVDTYLADNAIHRWSPSPNGPSWDFSRPIQGTLALSDDRPWLTAHGDGIVYLMSNNAAPVPGRFWLSISTDGGLTWLSGHAFDGRFCFPHASRADDHTVTVACYTGADAGSDVVVHRSTDRGSTWREAFRAKLVLGAGYLIPTIADDPSGTTYVAWSDERVEWSGAQDVTWAGGQPGRLRLASSPDGAAWDEVDVTPFAARYGMLYTSAGRTGTLGLTFYATRDLAPTGASEWRAYALVSVEAHAAPSKWTWAELGRDAMAVGPIPPRDLHENAFGPDNALHVVLQKNLDGPGQPGDGIVADILHVGQLAGPNLAGSL